MTISGFVYVHEVHGPLCQSVRLPLARSRMIYADLALYILCLFALKTYYNTV